MQAVSTSADARRVNADSDLKVLELIMRKCSQYGCEKVAALYVAGRTRQGHPSRIFVLVKMVAADLAIAEADGVDSS